MTIKLKMAVLGMAGSLAMLATPIVASAHPMQSWQPNIVEKAVSINQQTGEFSTLIAAASCTDVAERLSSEDRNFTVFAPTDAAFAKLGLRADNVCSAFDTDTLQNILEYHVTRGAKTAEQVLARHKLRMLSGDTAWIDGATIAGQNIVMTDVWASNGVIHVVDGVMMPPTE